MLNEAYPLYKSEKAQDLELAELESGALSDDELARVGALVAELRSMAVPAV